MKFYRFAHAALAACALWFPIRDAQAQSNVRPRITLDVGSGTESVTCDACGGNDDAVLSMSAELGASWRERSWLALHGMWWSKFDFIDGTDHSTTYLGLLGGYQVNQYVGARVGFGRQQGQYNSEGVASSGAAVTLGAEAILGRRRGIAARLHGEIVQGITGTRKVDFEGVHYEMSYKPRLIQVGVGLLWR